jgi:hypothetical protein
VMASLGGKNSKDIKSSRQFVFWCGIKMNNYFFSVWLNLLSSIGNAPRAYLRSLAERRVNFNIFFSSNVREKVIR